MSPRAKNFKVGSIIYFEGDKADSVYLLKDGKVNLIYDDLQIKEKVTDQILAGEFFGVKSGLIHMPREETAKVVANSQVFEFSAIEFESLIMKNTKILLKMLKVFSNQLRKVGKQIQNLVGSKVSNEPSDEFFQIGEYYLKSKKYKQALTVYQRYLNYYPHGKFAQTAKSRVTVAETSLKSYGDGGGPNPLFEDSSDESSSTDLNNSSFDKQEETSGFNFQDNSSEDTNNTFNSNSELNESSDEEESNKFDSQFNNNNNNSEEQKVYYKGVSLMSQGKYLDAYNIFRKILSMQNEEVKQMANFEIGKCLFNLGKFNECIKFYNGFISQYPMYNNKAEALYFIGYSYLKLGQTSSAKTFLNNIISTTNQNDSVYRKAQKALKELG